MKTPGDDYRWWLLGHFGHLATDTLPEPIAMENMPGLRTHHVFDNFVASLTENGYEVSVHIVHCADYGMPQRRTCLIVNRDRDKSENGKGYRTLINVEEIL